MKAAVAAYHSSTQVVSVADLTVNGVDLFLAAVNDAKQQATLAHDFNFQRKLLTLSVSTDTGGSLGDAVVMGTATPVTIKTLVDFGTIDKEGNFIPIHWTTVEDSLNEQRAATRFVGFRYPTDAQYHSHLVWGDSRLTIRGDQLAVFPRCVTPPTLIPLYIDAYVFDQPWLSVGAQTVTVSGTCSPNVTGTYTMTGTAFGYPLYYRGDNAYFLYFDGTDWIIASDPASSTNSFSRVSMVPSGTYSPNGSWTGAPVVAVQDALSDVWLQQASQYLLWQSVCTLNKLFKSFVPRQEGNLTEPQALADKALAAFIEWDVFKYEQNRVHRR